MKNDARAKIGVPERGVLLDCGRKYFSPELIRRLISTISDAGMNALYLHFSEDMGLRLESKRYPWLAGGDHTLCVHGAALGAPEDDGKYLTQDETRDIVAFAKEHGVEVVPSFDSPGHMNYAVKKYNAHFSADIGNRFHSGGRTSVVQGSSLPHEEAQTKHSRGIDISNPEGVEFARSLYTEYGEFFRSLGCVKFDVGGDELLGFGESIDDTLSKWQSLDHWTELAVRRTGDRRAVAYDAFLLYMNDVYGLMRDLGYTSVRMWNDDVLRSSDTGWQRVAELDRGIEIEYWSPGANGGANPAALYVDEGYSLYNFLNHYGYYVVGAGFRSGVTPKDVEGKWNAFVFDPFDEKRNLAPAHPKVKGGAICIWCDAPGAESAEDVLCHVTPYIYAAGKALSGAGADA